MTRTSLDLHAVVETAEGVRYRWDANQAPGSRLRNLSFSTAIGEGFSSGQGQLARRIDMDYPDLNLVDTITIVGGDGSVAWEGRVSAMPRELSDAHSIGVTLTGWMSHAKDRRFQEIYVDRDLNAWTKPLSANRRTALLAANFSPLEAGTLRQSDSDSSASVYTEFQGAWISPYRPEAEAWYDASGVPIGKISWVFNSDASLGIGADVNWGVQVIAASDDAATATTATANLRAAGVQTGSLTVTPTDRVFAFLVLSYSATPAAGQNVTYGIRWYNLAVYGQHTAALHVGDPTQPEGVYASEVIKDIAQRWCPELNTSGVVPTDYVIQHLAFRDRVFPYDAFLEINKHHLWQLAVWEDKTLHFRPYDLTDYDWEIRTDEQGTTFAPQGDAIDNTFNGIVVSYTDALRGTKHVLTPDTVAALGSTDPDNPWNRHGVPHWEEIELSTPTLEAQATQIGRAALADRSAAKTPGTITVKGYIRDRAGNEQPVWKVRAGDAISVTNFPNDKPRLIVETAYDDEQKQVTLSIDQPLALIDAYLDRVGSALTARGLS